MTANIAAIAVLAGRITDALVSGRPTAELRRELATLETTQRRELATVAAKERARRTEAEAAEKEAQQVAADALVAEAEARLRERLSTLEPPAAPVTSGYRKASWRCTTIDPDV